MSAPHPGLEVRHPWRLAVSTLVLIVVGWGAVAGLWWLAHVIARWLW